MNLQRRLLLSTVLLIAVMALFILWPSSHYSRFILELRGGKVITMLILGISGGIATVIFQTITGNRLLTPSLMGIDGIYLLMQSSLIVLLGSKTYNTLSPYSLFAAVAISTMIVATLLYTILLNKLRGDLYRLLLIGIIFSVFCRSIIGFISRIMDPTTFAVYQSVAFADINKANYTLQTLSIILIALTVCYLWRARHRLDIIALGQETAISLGVHYHREITYALLAITLLVALSTALVGPMLFFGLLASALTYRLFPTAKHSILLPAVSLIASLILLVGQLSFEQLLHFGGTLSMAVESLGGLLFLILITRQRA